MRWPDLPDRSRSLPRRNLRPGARAVSYTHLNHFSQVLPSFAFAMIAVGYSSSAAMSSTKPVVVIGLVGTFIFLAAAAAWILVKLPVAFAGMLRHGMAVEAGPTLWLGIPIMTLVGITVLRDVMGISHTCLLYTSRCV